MAPLTGDLSGRVVVVTGGTGGIGRETALGLARLGAAVIVAGRRPEKARSAARELSKESGAEVESAVADLSSMEEVRRLALDLRERRGRLDVLVNNAGVYERRRKTTPDGFEKTFAVNHLAPFLLTNLLLPALEESAAPGISSRVVTVSSGAHASGGLDFDDLHGEKRYGALRAYSRSKLANVLFTYELARRLGGKGVTANCLEPGFVKTDIALPFFLKALQPFFAASPEKAALAPIYLSSSPEVEGVSGRYFDADGNERSSSRASRDEETARRLWKVSEELTAPWLG